MNDFIYHISDNIDHIIRSIPLLKVELILAIGFLVSIVGTLFIDKHWKGFSFYTTIVTLLGAITALLTQYQVINTGFFGMLTLDKMSFLNRFLLLSTLIIISLFLKQYLQKTKFKKRKGDLYSLLLTAGIGLNLLTMTSNWLLTFIAIEIVSICSYLLVGYFSQNKKQAEAAMKYALFGAACSAIMLYGLSLVYGFTGELDFANPRHIQGLISAPVPITSIALVFIFTGIGFKLSFVPFHLWTPDVYQGAPTPVTAFLSTAPKIAILVLLARLSSSWISTGFYFSELTFLIITFIAIITMLAGNLIALRQTDIKRMMAYSSIGHTGFLLMAIIAYCNGHQDVLLFYVTVYTLMNLASFGFIDVLEQHTGKTSFASYTGMGKHWSFVFGWLTILGISLIGIPPTSGFFGKLLIFTTIFELYQHAGDPIFLWLLITGALTTVISLFYYFKIPLHAFLKNTQEAQVIGKFPISSTLIIAVTLSIFVLILGVFPYLILNLF